MVISRRCLVVVLSLLSACAHDMAPMGQRLLPNHSGRVTDVVLAENKRSDANACVPLQWTAATWRARFSQGDVAVQLRCAEASYSPCRSGLAVSVDGVAQEPLRAVGATAAWYTVARNMPPGAHTVQLQRLGEGQLGSLCLCGVRATGGRMLAPPPAQRRQLLVLGDSISAGYGNLCSGIHGGDAMDLQDGSQTYGNLAAQALGADVRIMAWSGIGVWRNGDGSMALTLPDRWAQLAGPAVPEGSPNRCFGRLDAIVINLGTNDMRFGPLDDAAFVRHYTAFVEQLHGLFPMAHIFVAAGPMLKDEPPNDAQAHPAKDPQQLSHMLRLLQEVRTQAQGPSVKKPWLHALEFTTQDGRLGYGCAYHPNVATHKQMAGELTQALQHTLGWSRF